MADPASLTHVFIERHPDSAARVLLAADAGAAATFLETLPPRLAAGLLVKAGPWPAARVLLPMATGAAAAILGEMRDLDAAAILRIADVAERNRILAEAPADSRRRIENSLDYPADAVGARMTTSIVMLGADTTASAALDAVRNARVTLADIVFVIDNGSEPLGAVSVAALLQSPATEVLAALADRAFPVVPARTTVIAAAAPDIWRDHLAVGVVDRQRRLIGALTRSAIDAAADGSDPPHASIPDSLLGSVSGAMLDSIGGLWTLFGDRGPGSKGNER